MTRKYGTHPWRSEGYETATERLSVSRRGSRPFAAGGGLRLSLPCAGGRALRQRFGSAAAAAVGHRACVSRDRRGL
jgi:hypothetical protein